MLLLRRWQTFLYEPDALRFQPSSIWLLAMTLVVLMGFASTYLLSEDLAKVFKLLLVIVGFVGFYARAGELRCSGASYWFVAACAIALVSWALSHLVDPQWAERSPKLHRLTNWTYFIAVAWLLAGRTRWTLALWAVAAAALFTTPWVRGDGLSEVLSGFSGRRVDFGLNNAEHTGMLFAAVFIGLLALSRRCLSGGPFRVLRMTMWVAGLLASGTVTIMSQTRGVWLGTAVALLVLAALLVRCVWEVRHPGLRTRIVIATLVGVIAVGAAFEYKMGNIVTDRVFDEQSVVRKLLNGQLPQNYSSISYRLNSWAAAIPWIEQKPIFGWGGNGRGLVMDHSEGLPPWIEKQTGHLHSTYFDTLVNFGMAGLAFFIGIMVWVGAKGIRAWRNGYMGGDMLAFYLAFSGFWLTVNLTESFMYYSTGQFVFALVLGGIVTHIWKMDRAKKTAGQ